MSKILVYVFKLYNSFKYKFWGIVNIPIFLMHRVKINNIPKIRGVLKICNYGNIEIGKNVTINSNLESSQLGFYPKTILHTGRTGNIVIGNNSGLSNATLYAKERIEIGKNVLIGAGVKIYDNDFHILHTRNIGSDLNRIQTKPVIIEDNVFVGAGTMILKGVVIGENSIIGAGSVVTKEIPAKELWAGNPAKFIRRIEIK